MKSGYPQVKDVGRRKWKRVDEKEEILVVVVVGDFWCERG